MNEEIENTSKSKEEYFSGVITLNRVIYPKNTTGECWGIVNCRVIDGNKYINEDFTFKGELPLLDYGKTYKVMAKPVYDDYGFSYQIILMVPYNNLKDTNQWKSFLASFLTENQVENIFSQLTDPIKTIQEHNIKLLCTVKGIKETTAENILEKYEDNKIFEDAFIELAQYDLSLNLIKKIVNHYRSVNKAINVIKENPYELAGEVEGIGFLKADEIGKKIGILKDNTKRIKGFIIWWLNERAFEGYSWVTPNTLCEAVVGQLGLESTQSLGIALKELFEAQRLYWNDKKTFVCLKKIYDLEKNIAIELKRLKDTQREFKVNNFDFIVNKIEKQNGWSFTEEQIQSAKNIIANPISIVTAKAGSGKTVSAQISLDCLKDNYNIALTAFSGKASARLQEATNYNASTIHRLLEYNPQYNAFMRNKENQLNEDIVLIDECSFLDASLFYSLLQAMKDGCKLIMLGDISQLEPIGFANVFKDIIESNSFNNNFLTKIHRQAAKSGIITESLKVSNGEQITDNSTVSIKTFGELKDLAIITEKSENLPNICFELFKKEYNKVNNIMEIQGLVPLKKRGSICLQILNEKIQSWYNKNDEYLEITRDGKPLKFKVGDKVINNVNNYKAKTQYGESTILYNGYTGIIESIDKQRRSLTINFGKDTGIIIVENKEIPNIDLAYFISIHKSQGDQWNETIIAFDMSAYKLLTKQLIYTAITRAKKRCAVCCENKALRLAISTDNVSKKQTFLKSFLKDIINEENK